MRPQRTSENRLISRRAYLFLLLLPLFGLLDVLAKHLLWAWLG